MWLQDMAQNNNWQSWSTSKPWKHGPMPTGKAVALKTTQVFKTSYLLDWAILKLIPDV